VFFGTYEEDYPRNQILRRALEGAGCEVVDCHVSVWKGLAHKTGLLARGAGKLRFYGRLPWAYARLAAAYLRTPRHDAVLVGYPGHLDALWANALRRLRGRPRLVLDVFVSLYDTAVGDRAAVKRGSALARLLAWLDRAACHAADALLLDTDAHVEFFERELGVSRTRFTRLWAGADEALFQPRAALPAEGGSKFRVLFVGKFIPLHGVDVVLRAAKLLEDDPEIEVRLVGEGQLHGEMRALADTLRLHNVEFVGWARYQDLPAELARCHVALGIFSPGGKALRVIPNKVFQALATGRPVITEDSPAVRELLVDGEHALLVRPGDPQALADAVRRLRADPTLRQRLATTGADWFRREASVEALAPTLRAVVAGSPAR
jgi:glycosyltransferase involved in cell wall biosynthesis